MLSERVARHVLELPAARDGLSRDELDAVVGELVLNCGERGAGTAASGAVQRSLAKVHEDLDCEWLEQEPESAWVLRARGARELYPLIDLLTDELTSRGTLVTARLPALGHAQAVARASACLGRDFGGTRVRVGFVRGHLLELAFAVPGCFGHADEQALEAATVYAEAALGEERLDEWVGSIGVSPAPRSGGLRVLDSAGQGSAVTPLCELAELVARGIDGLCEGLPDAPLSASSSSDWTLLDSEPLRHADGSPSVRAMDDVMMASTRCPELLKCFLEGSPVSSRRFSRVGEIFAYVKLPTELPFAERPDVRAKIERVIEPRLAERGVLVGNAVGLGHLYVVLALQALAPSLEALIACATEHPQLFPHGSEVRFLDATWAEEWLPLR